MDQGLNSLHPSALIGSGVTFGEGNVVGPYAVIHDGVVIGSRNLIGSHCVIGGAPEITQWTVGARGQLSDWLERHGHGVTLGDDNDIREFVSIQAGSTRPTVVGDNCLVMAHVHISHDCVLDDAVAMSGGVALAGHVTVGRRANLGLNASVHQFRSIGAGAMIGMGAAVVSDVPAFCTTVGIPARPIGLNKVLLQRLGVAPDVIDELESTAQANNWHLPEDALGDLLNLLAAG